MNSTNNELKSHVISDPDLIGLECDSGKFTSNCYLNDTVEDIPIGCEGLFMFSDQANGCETPCQENDTKRGKRDATKQGWTNFLNADAPLNKDSKSGNQCQGTADCEAGADKCCRIGTGDHEHYSYFQRQNDVVRDRLKVYQSDGTVFEDCTKKAIHVRQISSHESWWVLSNKYTL